MIDWSNIARAIEYYQTNGYEYVETPWFVPSETLKITCTDEQVIRLDSDPTDPWGLVGSAEQGFLQRALDDTLENNKRYVSAGPCFRPEPVFDELHHPQFMKVELFCLCDDESSADMTTMTMIYHAQSFMQSTKQTKTQDGRDLEINGIEVGSYGARYHEKIGWWAYGTGLAEPRYSTAIKGKL